MRSIKLGAATVPSPSSRGDDTAPHRTSWDTNPIRAIALPNRAAAFKSLYRKRLLQRGVNPLCSRRLRYNTLISARHSAEAARTHHARADRSCQRHRGFAPIRRSDAGRIRGGPRHQRSYFAELGAGAPKSRRSGVGSTARGGSVPAGGCGRTWRLRLELQGVFEPGGIRRDPAGSLLKPLDQHQVAAAVIDLVV